MRRYNLDAPVGYHQQRTAALEARQHGNGDARDGGGDNIYMIDNSVPRRLPHLPAFTFNADNANNVHSMLDTPQQDGFKLYESISLQSRANSCDNIVEKPSSSQSYQDLVLGRVRSVSDYSTNKNMSPPAPDTKYESPAYLTLEDVEAAKNEDKVDDTYHISPVM